MASYSKIPLSQSNYGKPIQISLSALPGNLIHTSVGTLTGCDEVWLYASNTGTSDNLMTFYWGSTATSDLFAQVNVQAYCGPTLISPGLILNNEMSIYGFAMMPSNVNITGYINRIS